MRTIRLYHPELSPASVGQVVTLNKEQTHHVVSVLRIKTGQPIILFDGLGNEFTASTKHIEKRSVDVHITGVKYIAHNEPIIHLGIAVSKGERMDWVVQKATELGAQQITPLLSKRVDVKLSQDRWNKKQHHWKKIIINACEQCGQNTLPQLHPVTTLASWIESCTESQKIVMDPDGGPLNLKECVDLKSVALLVGPEGGFDIQEIEQAHQQGFARWKLGDYILRTETAPAAGIAILQHCLKAH